MVVALIAKSFLKKPKTTKFDTTLQTSSTTVEGRAQGVSVQSADRDEVRWYRAALGSLSPPWYSWADDATMVST